MTSNEFQAVERLTLVSAMEADLRIILPDGKGPDAIIQEDDYNRVATQLRTWRAALKNSIEIRKPRSDAGKARK